VISVARNIAQPIGTPDPARPNNLTLLYADLKNLISFSVPVINKLKWIEDRIFRLYLSVHVMRTPPEAERSLACGYCKFKGRCDLDDPLAG
jgi:hypothetical protein